MYLAYFDITWTSTFVLKCTSTIALYFFYTYHDGGYSFKEKGHSKSMVYMIQYNIYNLNVYLVLFCVLKEDKTLQTLKMYKMICA